MLPKKFELKYIKYKAELCSSTSICNKAYILYIQNQVK